MKYSKVFWLWPLVVFLSGCVGLLEKEVVIQPKTDCLTEDGKIYVTSKKQCDALKGVSVNSSNSAILLGCKTSRGYLMLNFEMCSDQGGIIDNKAYGLCYAIPSGRLSKKTVYDCYASSGRIIGDWEDKSKSNNAMGKCILESGGYILVNENDCTVLGGSYQ